MDIHIRTIPHGDQRYETIGDYWFDDAGNLAIRVSDVGDWKAHALVAIHELVEVLLCMDRGIKEPDIMAFDRAFEAKRQPGNEDEPGDAPDAPYRKEHRFAENVERLVAAELGVSWDNHDAALCKVWHQISPPTNTK